MAGADLPKIPRRSDRYALPSTLAVVTAVLEQATEFGATSLTGKLWDVSTAGCCVAFPGLHRLDLPGFGHLTITHPFLAEIHVLGVELLWADAFTHITFVGMLFSPEPLAEGTFLDGYMQTCWADGEATTTLGFGG
jgi:hypothetical protein